VREIRLHGSEGGGTHSVPPTPIPDLRRARMLGAGLLTPPAGATEGLQRHGQRIAGDQSVLGQPTRLPESVGAPLDGMPAPNLPVLAPDLHKSKVVRFKST
jgi:hypothetical protein